MQLLSYFALDIAKKVKIKAKILFFPFPALIISAFINLE